MSKLTCVLFSVFVSAIAVDPYHRQIVVSPHSSGEIFYSGGERQGIPSLAAVAAPATPVGAVAAPPLTFTGSRTLLATPAVSAPVAVQPLAATVAQFKVSYPKYAYGYSVQDFTTGDNKVVKEVREGGIVKGSYSVADPDGTKRTVNYYADPIHGFQAVIHKTQILK